MSVLKSVYTKLSFAVIFFLLFNACKESEIYPPIPFLEWKGNKFVIEQTNLGFNDTLIQIMLSYKDGDGDIGLNQGDTFAPFDPQADSLGEIRNPYFYNLNVEYWEIIDGNLKPFILPNTSDTFKVRARITSLTPDGVHKAIRGDIQYEFQPPIYRDLRSDSIMLKITLYDRALHTSNVVESPAIVLP